MDLGVRVRRAFGQLFGRIGDQGVVALVDIDVLDESSVFGFEDVIVPRACSRDRFNDLPANRPLLEKSGRIQRPLSVKMYIVCSGMTHEIEVWGWMWTSVRRPRRYSTNSGARSVNPIQSPFTMTLTNSSLFISQDIHAREVRDPILDHP